MRRRRPPDEILVTLRGRLEGLPARSPERQRLILGCADLHGVSIATIYRALRDQFRPRALHRSDRGRPRKLPQREMERFCELVAAMKLRTTNLKNRHLSTGRAIELLIEHGAAVNASDKWEHRTPLKMAADEDVRQLLIDAGGK